MDIVFANELTLKNQSTIMTKTLTLILLISGLLFSGCYNAHITTGETPSNQTVDRPWASGWLFGLVPPSITNVAQECNSGVARVETKLSFLNMVANMITFGLYAPMHITVTCSAASAELPEGSHYMDLASDMDMDDALQQTITDAAIMSRDNKAPVYIRMN